MQNAVTRGELAPVALLEEVLCKAASKTAGIFDAIPGMVRRRVPRLNADDIDLIAGEIAKARNIVAAMSLADVCTATAECDEVIDDEQPDAQGGNFGGNSQQAD
jgi:phage terminase Nu1 subunit (DNA packaging protein)